MTYSHATSAANAQQIEASLSLLPRGNKPGNWVREFQQASHPEMVYLTNTHLNSLSTEFHGLRTALTDKSDEMVIYHFDILPEDKLYPEDNYFMPSLTSLYKDDLIEAQTKILPNKDKWLESWEQIGSVCYRGPLDPRDARIERIPIKQSRMAFMAEPEWTINEFEFRWQFMVLTKKPMVIERISEYKFTYDMLDRIKFFMPPWGHFHANEARDLELFPR
jgi:hypothetical protein